MWAAARVVQLEPWFKSWVPDAVVGAGYITAIDSEECFAGAVDEDVSPFCCGRG